MMPAELVREPKQVRSKESLERLMAAGVEVLCQTGYEGLAIADVGARAGVSVGSIYARFKSKEALFQALQVRMLAEIDLEQASLFDDVGGDGTDDPAFLREIIRRVADHVKRHDALLRVMIVRGAVDEDTRMRGSESSLLLARSFERILLKKISRFAPPEPDLAVDVGFRILYATLTRRIVSGSSFGSARHVDWETLVEELTRALLAYLLGFRDDCEPPAAECIRI